jgi:hypothetical protein
MPLLFDEDFLVRMGSGQASINIREVRDKSVLTKAAEWSYEKEWRLVGGRTGAERLHEDIPFDALELSAVILGCRMPTEDRFEFVQLLSRNFPHARILEAEKDPKAFRLRIREIQTIGSHA